AALSALGEVVEKGASFGVLGLRHSDMDIAMPRTERKVGEAHRDFDISVNPYLSTREASMRRDFTINAMMRDILTGKLIDHWGGAEDLKSGVIRCVSPKTFPEDALRVFRAAQFAARLNARIDLDTLRLCAQIDVTHISRERVFEECRKALLRAQKPSIAFRSLMQMDHLKEFFTELGECVNVPQNPKFHPEGDVFEHTMLVADCAAELRARAVEPFGFMLAALFHDLGKSVTTRREEDGRITSIGHETYGLCKVKAQMHRLTAQQSLIQYVCNMASLHMRPNMLAANHSKKKKTRAMFDLSVCPEDLILLSRADASGMLSAPYNPDYEAFLRERLQDYREALGRPMVTGEDLIAAGIQPGPQLGEMLRRTRQLHFSGIDRAHALRQVLAEYQK
ncbi:MAG: HD domain-containing protein, partial [Clostridia bacterium]|nr:HD domain-containing protein [Clostridia bacterium]